MMHPFATVVGLFDEELGSTHGPWGQHLHCLEFYETDASRGFVRGAKWGLQPTGGPVSMTRAYPWGDNAIWGVGFHDGIRKRLGRTAMWGIIAEDLPDEANRVVLDPKRTDSDGIPAPKIIYRTSEQSHRLLDFHWRGQRNPWKRPAPTRPWLLRRFVKPDGICSARPKWEMIRRRR